MIQEHQHAENAVHMQTGMDNHGKLLNAKKLDFNFTLVLVLKKIVP